MRVLALVLLFALAAVASAQTITFAADTAKNHRTAKYRDTATGKPQTRLNILRRHQSFIVTVPGATPASKYFLELTAADRVPLKIVKASAGSAELQHTQGAIGAFKLVVEDGAKKIATTPVIFIANPYMQVDETFIGANAAKDLFPPELAEHLENEKGALWQGSSRSNSWIPWAYNQFDVSIIETTVGILNGMNMKQRASTALITRYLTSQSSEVLRGRWDGQYSDGKQPGFWSSTTQIVAEYQRTKQVVKYGQCWVFAGLLTAFCRSIGIPSRPLTNFDSAHEHAPFDQQCHTKYTKTADGGWKKVEADNSIWNFHVWVDAWMARPDIAGGKADGWQAIDATPQEESKGPNEAPFANSDYRCGPAPHASIYNMDVKGAYDVAFVAGEANCLKVDYVDGKEVSRDPSNVGETIITKTPDSKCNGVRMDGANYNTLCKTNLARSYSKAGSFLQVAAMVRAARYKVTAPEEGVRLGKPFKVSIKPASTNTVPTEYSIVLSATSYNSAHNFGVLKTATGPAGATVEITAADWAAPFLKDQVPTKTNTIDVLIVAKPARGAAYVKHLMIPVLAPRLAMLCGAKQRKFKPNQVIACNVQFQNPLPYPLTKAVMAFSISGQPQQSVQQQQQQSLSFEPSPVAWQNTEEVVVDHNSRSTFKAKFQLNGAVGKQVIIAKLSTKELDGITGIMEIDITNDA